MKIIQTTTRSQFLRTVTLNFSLYLMLKDLKFSGLEKYSGSYFQDGFEETVMPGERRKDVSWNIKIQGKLMEDPVLISCKFAISNKSGDEVQENTELK